MIDDPDEAAEAALHPSKPQRGLDANGLIIHRPDAMDLDYPAIFAQRPWDKPGYKPTTGPVYDEALAAMRDIGQRDSFGCVDIDDMIGEPSIERRWAWDGILGAGRSMLLAGEPKIGKSTFARVWAFATASCVPFLGRAIPGGAVLWIAADGESRETFKLHASALRPHYALKHAVKWAGYADMPPVNERVEWLKRAIATHKYALVIIDNIINFFELGENDTKYGLIAKATTPLLAVMQTTGTALVMLTHTNNARKILGGGGWTRVADINVIYEQGRGSARYIESVLGGREDTSVGPWAIGYDRTTKQVFVDNSPLEKAVKEAEQSILDLGPGTYKELTEGCPGDTGVARRALQNLVDCGLLVITMVGRRKIYSEPESRPPALSVVQTKNQSLATPLDYVVEAHLSAVELSPSPPSALVQPSSSAVEVNRGFVVTTGAWTDDVMCVRCGENGRCIPIRGEGYACEDCLATSTRGNNYEQPPS